MDVRKIKCYDLYIKRKGKAKSQDEKKQKNEKKLLTGFSQYVKITEWFGNKAGSFTQRATAHYMKGVYHGITTTEEQHSKP